MATGRCRAFEPSASAAEFGRQQLGLDIHQGTLADAPVDDASFDVITMWDVLEHLHDPVDAIQRVAAMPRPGGMFIIRVPHLESLDARVRSAAIGPGWTLPAISTSFLARC